MKDITACITTFSRPESLNRLLESIKKFYPNLPILVEDTKGNLSAGRNRLVEKCTTEYQLMLEDDFVFTEATKIEPTLEALKSLPEYGGLGGLCREPKHPGTVNRGKNISWDRRFQRVNNVVWLNHPDKTEKFKLNGIQIQPCDIVLNFGVFRNQMFRDVQWNETLPVQEHTDYFWRLYLDARWKIAYTPNLEVLHLRERPNRKYKSHRSRSFTKRIQNQIGVRFENRQEPTNMPIPNIVFLSVGRANSTITTKMIANLFNMHTGNLDEEYWEERNVRSVNHHFWKTGKFNGLRAQQALRKLPQPWIIKDPAFRRSFPHWVQHLKPYDPLLVYVTKDPKTIEASYRAKNWDHREISNDIDNCDRFFINWPMRKIKLEAEKIADVISLFDQSRCKHEKSLDTVDDAKALIGNAIQKYMIQKDES